MGHDIMDLKQLASYLHRDLREVSKLASRGQLPGQKIGGEWRFHRAEIDYWVETQMHGYTDKQLIAVESGGPRIGEEFLLCELLSEASIAVPLRSTNRPSILRELVSLAEHTWHVYEPDAILEAIQAREEMGTTALPVGVAIPHPRRCLPSALAESVMAYGRSLSGIPFGAPHGGLTDIFFLVCCQEAQTHMRVLARLNRLLLRPDFLDDLRDAETPAETFQVIEEAEQSLLAHGG